MKENRRQMESRNSSELITLVWTKHSPATPLLCNRHARLCIVHVRCYDKLQQLGVLADDVLRCSVLLVPPEPIICLDDLCQLVCKIILTSVTMPCLLKQRSSATTEQGK
jgi:hypothetical protein